MLVSFLVFPARAQGTHVRPLTASETQVADFAREGAMRRLRVPECLRILTDFKDPDGRTLVENLAPFALSPEDYLARIPFLDGKSHSLCSAGQSQLLTTRGVARVFVCKAFLRTVGQQRAQAEVYVIHEMLHTLGLGENPPTSQEITRQVARRCAP
jgi:hypothetical protein